VVCEGFKAGDTPLPDQVLGENIEQTLRNLICYLDPLRDTIRHPDWDRFHPANPQVSRQEATGTDAAGWRGQLAAPSNPHIPQRSDRVTTNTAEPSTTTPM